MADEAFRLNAVKIGRDLLRPHDDEDDAQWVMEEAKVAQKQAINTLHLFTDFKHLTYKQRQQCQYSNAVDKKVSIGIFHVNIYP